MRPTRLLTSLASAVLLLLAALLVSPAPQAQAIQTGADLATRWAPAAKAKIHPGVQMFTKGAQCTGNFVFKDRVGRVYVGYAAHCAGKGAATDTNGCNTRSHPIGTRVRFADGATLATNGTTVGGGTLVYSSWIKMRRRHTQNRAACEANDFALVRVDRNDRRKVNPSVPFWGGPTGLSIKGAPQGSQVFSWGHSSLRPDRAAAEKTGVSLGRTHRGWGWEVYTATPGIPGDSGSGFLDARGRAFGTLSTVQLAPKVGANGLGDLEHELRFAQSFSGIRGLHLVRGTKKFSPVP
jgi:hypothetical protein